MKNYIAEILNRVAHPLLIQKTTRSQALSGFHGNCQK